MKKLALFAPLIIGLVGGFSARAQSQSIETMPPVAVKTFPESGSKDVAPGDVEIKVTFSKDMTDQSWSWGTAWEGSNADGIDKPHYDADHRTCILKVKLLPNKTYAYWINSGRLGNFKDKQGHSAVPYLLIFQTKGK